MLLSTPHRLRLQGLNGRRMLLAQIRRRLRRLSRQSVEGRAVVQMRYVALEGVKAGGEPIFGTAAHGRRGLAAARLQAGWDVDGRMVAIGGRR